MGTHWCDSVVASSRLTSGILQTRITLQTLGIVCRGPCRCTLYGFCCMILPWWSCSGRTTKPSAKFISFCFSCYSSFPEKPLLVYAAPASSAVFPPRCFLYIFALLYLTLVLVLVLVLVFSCLERSPFTCLSAVTSLTLRPCRWRDEFAAGALRSLCRRPDMRRSDLRLHYARDVVCCRCARRLLPFSGRKNSARFPAHLQVIVHHCVRIYSTDMS